jgi:hypothetical protein
VITPPARQVLRFLAGGVPLAVPLATVREILPVGPDGASGGPDGAVDLAASLGLRGEPRFALLPSAAGMPVLLVDRMDGVGDLADAQAFRLPEGTVAADPSPFQSVLRFGGTLYLELAPASLGTMARRPPRPAPPLAALPFAGRELLAERGGRVLAVPLPLVVHVVDPAPLFRVPLAPEGHRGILLHGRALHPAWDAAHLLGEGAGGDPRVLLLLDAGGTTAGVLVDRVRGFSEGAGDVPVRRPPWDQLLDPARAG